MEGTRLRDHHGQSGASKLKHLGLQKNNAWISLEVALEPCESMQTRRHHAVPASPATCAAKTGCRRELQAASWCSLRACW